MAERSGYATEEQILATSGKWIGHVLRHDEFLQEIFEGRMKGRSTRGRKKIQLLDDLADGKDYASLKREAEDRSVWRIRH